MQIKITVIAAAFLATLMAFAHPAAAQSDPDLPYWASIDVDVARMRVGPSVDFPIKWIYRRKYLPVKVVDRVGSWRKVEDPGGDQGWVHSRLLSGEHTAIVTGAVRVMRSEPDGNARIAWRAEPGVVGRISDCDKGWCLFDVSGRRGWIQDADIWGEEKLLTTDDR